MNILINIYIYIIYIYGEREREREKERHTSCVIYCMPMMCVAWAGHTKATTQLPYHHSLLIYIIASCMPLGAFWVTRGCLLGPLWCLLDILMPPGDIGASRK